jgi:RNA polymerase sigma factor (sigma-70 family)
MADTLGKAAVALLPVAAAGRPALSERTAPAQRAAAATEEELVRGAMAGDRAAWQGLVHRHDRRVVLSLLGRGLPLDRAREIAQETWTRLMESQRAGRLSGLSLPGLAIVQAGYLCTSEWRRQGIKHQHEAAAERTEPGAGGPAAISPEDQVSDRQALARVAKALEACPPGARRVFDAVYQNPELGYEEIAARVGLSTQRVKQIVCEVRKRLRAVLRDEVP